MIGAGSQTANPWTMLTPVGSLLCKLLLDDITGKRFLPIAIDVTVLWSVCHVLALYSNG